MKGLFSHKLLSGLIFILLAVFAFIPMTDEAKAASKATVTISSGEVTKGKEIEVTIKVDAETNIGAYDFYVTYDPNILEAVSGYEDGGNGQLQLMGYISDTSDLSSSKTFKIKFKALAVGSSKIEYLCLTSDKGIIDYDTVENMEVTASAGTVNVKAPYIASSNKDLASLKVAAVRADGSSYTLTLSPKFSNSVTKYSLTTEEGVTKLVVTAKAEDDKATVKVSGATLKGGTNTTTITVTAEDGSTRKYTITTTVPVPPTTTAPPPEPVIVIMDGKEYHIKDISETTKVPEGFEAVEYDYKDEKVMVAKGLSKNLIVMYITDSEGANGGLYIYDEGKDIFYPMSNIQVTDKLYTIVKYPEDLIVPEGYVQGEITVGDVTFNGWTNTELDKVYLVYAMNWNGEEGLYFYDTAEGQMIKYFELSVEAGVGLDEYNQLVVENEKLKDEINQLKKDNTNEVEKKTSLYKYISIICAVMAAIYLGVIIILLVKRRGKNEDTEAYEDAEESNQSEAIDEAADTVDDTENSEADVDTENIDNAMEAALASEVAAAMMDGVELAETPSEVIDPETVEESEVVVEPVIEAELETAEEIETAEEPETEVEATEEPEVEVEATEE
ncbi:MAG: cadherin-like beta sandwich domain-containing protein, partial [Lachnospiraceae bacterium]|nr:cadherin-like beta sandwich domain-containing protein [Lachnospiraceae bacterium]